MVIGNCIRKMFGATSVMFSVAGSCSWRAGLTTQLGYLLVSTFGRLRTGPSGSGPPVGRRRGRRLHRHERPLAVEPQLSDALADVVEGPVSPQLLRPLGPDAGVPAPDELLHRRHVDRPVVQPVLDV